MNFVKKTADFLAKTFNVSFYVVLITPNAVIVVEKCRPFRLSEEL